MANTNLEKSPILLRQQADRIVTRTCFYSAGIGLIPVPLADAALILGVQMLMIKQIADVYGVPFKKNIVKSLIGSLAGNLGAVGAVKFIPGLGSTLGAAAISVGGVAVTYALGQVFTQHFAKGGNLTDFEPEDWRASFEEVYQKKLEAEEGNPSQNGKEVAQDVKAQTTLLHQKQLVLKEELKEVEEALNKLKEKRSRRAKKQSAKASLASRFNRKWVIGIGVLLLLIGLWFFRGTLLPDGVNQKIDAWVDSSAATIDSLEHEIGIDSLIQEVSNEMDSLVSDVASEVDSLVNEVSAEIDTLSTEINKVH